MSQFPKFLRDKIINHLRRIGYLNVTYKDAMASAHRQWGDWECCQCKQLFKRKDLHGDHIDPIINTKTGFTSWDSYIEKLFLGQIQPLCKGCHKIKTAKENAARYDKDYGKWEDIG